MNLPVMTGWGYSKDFPRPARTTFRQRWEKRSPGKIGNQPIQSAELPVIEPEPQKLPILQNKARFEAEPTALGGNFITCNQNELPQEILALLKEKGITEIMAWDADQLPDGIAPSLQDTGIQINYGCHPLIRAGISGAVAASAETGTILITSGTGRPLSTSLLPEIHIAILKESEIYEKTFKT